MLWQKVFTVWVSWGVCRGRSWIILVFLDGSNVIINILKRERVRKEDQNQRETNLQMLCCWVWRWSKKFRQPLETGKGKDIDSLLEPPEGMPSLQSILNFWSLELEGNKFVLFLSWEDPLERGMAAHSRYSGLENSMDRGAWQATVHGAAKSQTWLSNFHFHFSSYCLIIFYNNNKF